MQINRTRGDTSPDVIFVSDGRDVVDLTGCSALMTLNTVMNPTDTTTQLYQVSGVFNLVRGSISFSPTEAQANLLGLFYYDIQLTESNGTKRTLIKDAYLFTQDITK